MLIEDLLVLMALFLIGYRPLLWVARKLVRREEEMIDEIKKGAKNAKPQGSSRAR